MMRSCHEPLPASWERICTVFMAIVLAVALLAGCSSHKLPPPAPAAVPVLVPITKPCKVAKVEVSPLPSASMSIADIWEAAKAALADREVLLADRERLVAANTDPCPEITK